MLEWLSRIFSETGLMPHGHCYLWQPGLVWTHVGSDVLIALSYFTITATLYSLLKKIRIPFSAIVLACGAVIAICGCAHLMEVWTLWVPHYWLSGALKAITALASAFTALWILRRRDTMVRVLRGIELSEQRRSDLESMTRELESRVQAGLSELAQRESQLRLITDSLPVRISYVDRNQIYRFANKAYEESTGLGVAQIIGKSVRELLGDKYDQAESHIQRALSGENITYEAQFPNKTLGMRDTVVNYVPDRGEDGEIRGFITLVRDVTERNRLTERERFLNQVTDSLSSSLDYSTTLTSITLLATRHLADFCFLDILDERGLMKRVSASHVDHTKAELLDQAKKFPISPDIMTLPARVVVTGQPLMIPSVTREFIKAASHNEEHERLLQSFEPRSMIFVPLRVRGRVLGALTLGMSNSGRVYTQDDLRVAEEMAARSALAVDNSLLYRDAEYERRRLKAVFDQSPALLIILKGVDLVPEYSTPLAQRLFGGRIHHGKPLRDTLPEFGDQGFLDLMLDVFQSGKPFVGQELPIRIGDGLSGPVRDGYYDFVYQPTRDNSGRIDGLIVISVDVTERVLARRALAQSEDRLRLAIEAMELGTFDYFPATQQLIWSDRLKELFGLPQGSVVDFTTFFKGVHPDDRERVRQTLTRALMTEDGSEYLIEFRTLGLRDGQERWLLARGKVYFKETGTAVRLVGTILDITHRRKAEEELRSAVRSRDEFLSMASHELKTPLTSLKLQTQMIKRSLLARGEAVVLTPERMKKLIEQTDRQVDRLSRLVDDMLDISRISTGTLALQPELVDLGEMVEEVTDRLRPLLNEAGCDVILETQTDVIGSWDRFRLEQVVTNLLTNAARYGSGRPVEIIARTLDDGAAIIVKDRGRGIAPEDQERIFMRFERAIAANEVSGLGLGLYIARQIVEKHYGTIHVDSAPGQGATFTVVLPLAWQQLTPVAEGKTL